MPYDKNVPRPVRKPQPSSSSKWQCGHEVKRQAFLNAVPHKGVQEAKLRRRRSANLLFFTRRFSLRSKLVPLQKISAFKKKWLEAPPTLMSGDTRLTAEAVTRYICMYPFGLVAHGFAAAGEPGCSFGAAPCGQLSRSDDEDDDER